MNKYIPLAFCPSHAATINVIFNLSLLVMPQKNVSAMLRAMRQLLQNQRQEGWSERLRHREWEREIVGQRLLPEHNLYA